MSLRPQHGFTLFELVVTVAIAAVLAGVAAPSFVEMTRDARLGGVVDPVRRALVAARSEATRSRRNVTVCPRASDTACGTDWNDGLLVFVDGVVSGSETSATRDADDALLSIVAPHGTDAVLKVFASNDRTAAGRYVPNFIRYGADGRANWQNGSVVACDARGAAHSRALNVTLTGSVREGRTGDAGVALDVFGRAIDCP